MDISYAQEEKMQGKHDRRALIVHISDTHVRSNDKDNIIIADNLIRLFTLINKQILMDNTLRTIDDIFIVISGDCTDDGNPKQYNELRHIIYNVLLNNTITVWTYQTHINIHFILCIGNHDVSHYGIETIGDHFHPTSYNEFQEISNKLYDNIFTTIEGYKAIHTQHLDKFANTEASKKVHFIKITKYNLGFIILDSNTLDDEPLHFARGKLGDKTIATLTGILNNNTDIVPFVIMHHDPTFKDTFQLLEDSNEILDALDCTSTNTMLLYGHTHRYALTLYGYPIDKHVTPLRFCAGTEPNALFSSGLAIASCADTFKQEHLTISAFIIDQNRTIEIQQLTL